MLDSSSIEFIIILLIMQYKSWPRPVTIMLTDHGLFLEIPKKRGLFTDSVSIILGAQCGLCFMIGIVVLIWPNVVRNYLTDNATSKCERLAGCGLTDCLFQIIGSSLLCGSFLAFLALRFRDMDARAAVAQFFLLTYAAVAFVIFKGRNVGVYNDLVFSMLLPWIGLVCVIYLFAIRTTPKRKDPRSPDPISR